jgi:hypothetical protein
MSDQNLFRAGFAVLAICCSAGTVPGASAETAGPATYKVGARPRSIAVADFNGDSRLDVVVANSGDQSLTLLLGARGGQLEVAAPAIPAGNEPADVDAVDVDNDHDIDLVVANHETSHIRVLLNDGKAHFVDAPGSPFDTGARPHLHGVATGDFDGDGWNDVAVESSGTDEVRVLRGSPLGFSKVLAIPVGTMPYYRLGAADVDNDGHVDVVVPGHGDNTVRAVLFGQNAPTTAGWTLPLPRQPWMVVGDDVDGDGRDDIVVVLTNAVGVWLNRAGGFSPTPGSPWMIDGATEVATGDLNGDGVADIVVGPWDGAVVTIISGRSFSRRSVGACERPVGLAIADLDGDGRGEVLATCVTEDRLIVLTGVSDR